MKKICSLLLAIAMIAATFAVISIPAAALVEGDWNVYTIKSQYLEGYNGIMHNVAGYEYTDEGFSIVQPDEEDAEYATPYVTAQTKNKVDLKMDGVYMKVRVDDFTYSGDTWFSFHVWTEENVEPGKQGPRYGYGVETLIKPRSGSSYDPENPDQNHLPGALMALNWYSDPEEGIRTPHGSQSATASVAEDQDNNDAYIFQDDFNEFDEEGRPIFTLEIKWREDSMALGNPDGIPEMYINGAKAPDSFNLKMADIFKPETYQAYVGFSLQNSTLGGEGAFTILKFGTCEADATTPDAVGDSKDPEIKAEKWEDPQPADQIPTGEPAITLSGNSEEAKGLPSAYNGNKLTVNNDGSVTVDSQGKKDATISLRVNDEISYAVEDFPIVLLVFKNLCTCPSDFNYDTKQPELSCKCEEKLTVFANAGNIVKDDQTYSFPTLSNEKNGEGSVGAAKDKQGNSYLYVMANLQDAEVLKDKVLEGRIHGLRVDIYDLAVDDDMPGRDKFDVCIASFFRNTDEAKAYAKQYIEMLAEDAEFTDPNAGGNTSGEQGTTTPDGGDTTTPDGGDTTTPGGDTNTSGDTAAPETKPEETNAPKTEAKTEAKTEEEPEGGCGSTVGLGALAVICLAGAGLISFRKKED